MHLQRDDPGVGVVVVAEQRVHRHGPVGVDLVAQQVVRRRAVEPDVLGVTFVAHVNVPLIEA